MIFRDALYERVWSTPMQKLATEFSVSGSYLSRVCSYLDIPKPGRGYWAKHAAGKRTQKIPLPPQRPGFPTSWQKGIDISVAFQRSEEKLARLRLPDSNEGDGIHYLLRDARVHFEKTRTADKGDYLRPFKRVLVDIRSSAKSFDRAFELANFIFRKLDAAKLRVGIAGAHDRLYGCDVDEREVPRKEPHHRYPGLWSPDRPTVIYGPNATIGVALIEMSELIRLRYVNGEYIRDEDYQPTSKSRYLTDHSWTTDKEIPSGRFRLVLFSPHPSVHWTESFQETKSKTLESQVGRIVSRVKSASKELVAQIEEARQQAEIAHQQYLERERIRQEEEHRTRLIAAREESEKLLRQGIVRWGELKLLADFLQNAEKAIDGLPSETAMLMAERLRLAREMLGSINPLDFLKIWKTPDEIYK